MSKQPVKPVMFWAVMPAAGTGLRMQQTLAKQYIEIKNAKIIEHSAGVLLANDNIKQIVVSVAQDDAVWPTLALAQDHRIVKAIGGATRAQSVLNGLHALIDAQAEDWVLVHDAARPCLSSVMLNKLIAELKNDPVGGILAMPVKDTLKLARSKNALQLEIKKTIDRAQIWQAQTPQMFRYALLKDALTRALNNNAEITDEASAIEWAGHQPKLIESDARNLKVTTPEDIALAEFLLS